MTKKVNGTTNENGADGILVVDSLDGFFLKDGGLVLEIFGPPKSGKSWQIRELVHRLQREPAFQRLWPDFDYRVLKINLKDDYSKEDRGNFHLCYALGHSYHLRAVRLKRKHPNVNRRGLDLVIADRGPIDDNYWAYELHEEGELSLEERDYALSISKGAEGLVDAGILIGISSEEALKREREKLREISDYHGRLGKVMNPTTLAGLCRIYNLTANRQPYRAVRTDRGYREAVNLTRRHILPINGEDQDKDANAQRIYDFVLQLSVPTSDEYRELEARVT